jgi:hypothetical protein
MSGCFLEIGKPSEEIPKSKNAGVCVRIKFDRSSPFFSDPIRLIRTDLGGFPIDRKVVSRFHRTADDTDGIAIATCRCNSWNPKGMLILKNFLRLS